ncbi:MAG: hypothetical protein LBT42_05035 [Tannerella sp.]|jgi:hypothetical protein|nr:hypothetical protein [Tannerella sp.]
MKRITFFIASILCLTACNNDINGPIGDYPVDTEGRIELRMPDATTVGVYSNATQSECMIDSVWVLEFHPTTGVLLNSDHVGGSKIMGNGQAVQLLPQLSFKPTIGNRIVCIANTNSGVNPAGVTISTINDKFKLNTDNYYIVGEYLPMYGETVLSSSYMCEMTREVAKVQVQMGESVSDVTGAFTAENVSYAIYNIAKYGYVQPYNGEGYASGPGYVLTYNTFRLLQKAGATDQEKCLYLHEYKSSTRILGLGTGNGISIGDDVFSANRQHIILYRAVNATDTFYYRLDFYDPSTGKYLDTKRNHHYLFTINRVGSEGYKNLNGAQNNPGSNIEYTVTISDGARHISSNGQYAIVTSVDTAKISSSVTSQNIAKIRYQLGAGMPALTAVTYSAVAAGPGLTLNSPTTLMAANTNVDVNITADATFTAGTTGTITFTLGNVKHVLYVKRQ